MNQPYFFDKDESFRNNNFVFKEKANTKEIPLDSITYVFLYLELSLEYIYLFFMKFPQALEHTSAK